MMNRKTILQLVALFGCCFLSGAETLSADAKQMIEQADLGRQEVAHKGDMLVQQGHTLYANGEYFAARDKFLEAIKLFRRYPGSYFAAKIEFCQKEIAECYYAKATAAMARADKAASTQDFDEAIKICNEAIKYCPEQVEKLQNRISLYEKRREKSIQLSALSEERLLPNKQTQDYKIQVLLEQGRRLTLAKDYSGAIEKFNAVILIDPYNAEATAARRGLYAQLGSKAQHRFSDNHKKMVSEIEWKYAVPIIPFSSGSAENVITGASPKPTNEALTKSELRKRLDEIKLRAIKLTDMPISAVIKNLQELSRVSDKNKRGINLIYIPSPRGLNETEEERLARETAESKRLEEQQKKKEEKKKAKNDDEESSEESEEEEEDKNDEQKVNLETSDNTSLYEILKSLCSVSNTAFTVEEHAVIVTPKDRTLGAMELKTYAVNSAANLTTDSIRDVLKAKCGENIFPKGSHIYYNAETRRVCITNTADNQRVLGEALEKYFVQQVPQVQIQIKLIDINQNDLDELAFNWQLQVNTKQATQGKPDGWYNGTDANTKTNTSKFIMGENNSLLRYYQKSSEGISANAGNIDDSFLTWAWQNGNGTRIVASMFAMNQADSTDVLQSPRVTVKDGQTATIKMVENHNYPDKEWTQIDSVSSEYAYYAGTAQPDLSQEEELGINFTVQPTIDLDRQLITVPVHVPFKTFSQWLSFDTRNYDDEGNVEDGAYYQMAILNTPEIKTRVTVHDGDTVIVGGIISDSTKTLNDKIPILGDIPFIGRFFQSKGTTSEKRNLLVFLTCRLVKPDGSPMFPNNHIHGIPDFGRGL